MLTRQLQTTSVTFVSLIYDQYEPKLYLRKSALQILAIVITPVCVCMNVTFSVKICSHVAKNLIKNHLYVFEHFQSKGLSPVFVHIDLDLHF